MLNEDKLDLLIKIQNRQMAALERIADALEKIAGSSNQPAPSYERALEQFADFDWGSIGAEIQHSDEHGPAVVNWNGRQFFRRSPSNKFGAAIWYSRSTGKDSEGKNEYERLITFKPLANRVDPLPPKVSGLLRSKSKPAAAVTTKSVNFTDLPQSDSGVPTKFDTVSNLPDSGQLQPALYPENNAIVKQIRTATGHSSQQVLEWCRAMGVQQPDHLPPEKLPHLIEWLALGWAVSQTGTPLDGLRNSYRGRTATMQASGQTLLQAALGWIEAQQSKKN